MREGRGRQTCSDRKIVNGEGSDDSDSPCWRQTNEERGEKRKGRAHEEK